MQNLDFRVRVRAVGDFVYKISLLYALQTPHPNPVLDYSGEHNISITTNPYGFFLLFSCYLLLRACSLTLDIALPKIRSPKGEGTKVAQFSRITPSLGGGCRRRERVLLNFTIPIFKKFPTTKYFILTVRLNPHPKI